MRNYPSRVMIFYKISETKERCNYLVHCHPYYTKSHNKFRYLKTEVNMFCTSFWTSNRELRSRDYRGTLSSSENMISVYFSITKHIYARYKECHHLQVFKY